MEDHSSRSRAARARLRSVIVLGVVCLGVFTAVTLSACGGDSSDTGTIPTTLGESVSTTIEAEQMDPSALGDTIAAIWAEAMQRLNALLETKPEPDAVRGQVEQLKEEYITQLVELGRQRETLDLGESAQVSARTAAGLSAAASETWFTTYMGLYESYAAGDQEFANLLASFNILTQYADFELLKQQSPEEAARLGIE